MFCPPQTAWELHKGLPQSKLYIIPGSGHSTKVKSKTSIVLVTVFTNI